MNAHEEALSNREVEVAERAVGIVDQRMLTATGEDLHHLSEVRKSLSGYAKLGRAFWDAHKQSAQQHERLQSMKPANDNERVQALYGLFSADVVDHKPGWIEGDNAREDNPHTPA